MKYHRLRVGDLARSQGLNYTTFGYAAKLAPGSARAWMTGDINKFEGDVMERVACALGVTVSDLFEPIPAEEREQAEESA